MNADEQLFEGSCLCGQVRYRAIGPFVDMLHCHCTDCQKCHGGAFMTGVGVKPGQFTIVQGQDRLQMFQAESGTRRSFCRTCGSKIKVENDRWKETYVPAGTIEDQGRERSMEGDLRTGRHIRHAAHAETRPAHVRAQQGSLVRDPGRPAAARDRPRVVLEDRSRAPL
jgi:hypothetical protein